MIKLSQQIWLIEIKNPAFTWTWPYRATEKHCHCTSFPHTPLHIAHNWYSADSPGSAIPGNPSYWSLGKSQECETQRSMEISRTWASLCCHDLVMKILVYRGEKYSTCSIYREIYSEHSKYINMDMYIMLVTRTSSLRWQKVLAYCTCGDIRAI